MEVQALCIRVTDDDAARLVERIPEDELPAREMKATFTAEGVVIEGKYPTVMLTVPFRMLWRATVFDEKVRSQLMHLDFYNLPAGPLRGLILSLVRDELAHLPGVTLDGETITLDLAVLLSSFGIPVTITPREVRHEPGAIVFVA